MQDRIQNLIVKTLAANPKARSVKFETLTSNVEGINRLATNMGYGFDIVEIEENATVVLFW